MKDYYYSDGLQKHGPFSLEELRAKKLTRNTMVWRSSMEKWIPAEQMPELEGTFREESAQSVDQQPNLQYERPPRTWLVESILVTVFCCLPFGIAGIVNAARVESRFNCGDISGAERSSEEAGKWTKIGFWIGIVWVVICVALMAFGVAIEQYN
ncbi:CD225/dispanin family protein [Salinimicrobium gaetbulicola]|uniref:CD225/dispanin family protein n=1 Tax=Salinimicrobium gaetbulicola TaxID=999702 RepID=A0ABW3IC03_9FLAO